MTGRTDAESQHALKDGRHSRGLLHRLSRVTSDAPKRQARDRGRTILRAILAILLGIATWAVLARVIDSPVLFPSPSQTITRFQSLLTSGRIQEDLLVSSVRILCGFAAGTIVGILIGFLTAASRTLAAIIDPFVHFFRFVPPIVWFGPMLLIFGTGEGSKILLVVYTTFFVVAISTHAGALAVPLNAVRAAQTFGASKLMLFRRVILPASAGQIINGMRIAMANSFMTIVVAEMLGADSGLGNLITRGTLMVDTSVVFVGALLLGAMGLSVDLLLRGLVERFGARFVMGR